MSEFPVEAHGITIPLDDEGNPRLFTAVDTLPDQPKGTTLYRRMTSDEVDNWVRSKSGGTRIRPAGLAGRVP
jgi:hypothetical protein